MPTAAAAAAVPDDEDVCVCRFACRNAQGVIDESTPELLRTKLTLLYRSGVKTLLSDFRKKALENT
jgi:hypothetical protein